MDDSRQRTVSAVVTGVKIRAAPVADVLEHNEPAVVGLAVAAAFAIGAAGMMRVPTLPSRSWLAALLVVALVVWLRPRFRRWNLRLAAVLTAGFAWAGLHGHHALAQRIDEARIGVDLGVVGTVTGLVRERGVLTRFDFRLEQVDGAAELAGRRVSLSWYGDAPPLAPGQRWALQVRLKRPRGTLNPGGFDFERRALERRLAATGYVRDVAAARPITGPGGLDAWRGRMAARVDARVPSESSRFVRALALGDTRGLDERDWEVLRATGLSHLLAISGFHVGVVAGFGALLARGVYWLLPGTGRRLPLPQTAAIAALVFAAGYAAAAGFALPTVRALLMIGAALGARLLRRHASFAQAFALALLAVVAVDPLAVLAAGFWLSFLGVGWLLWCLAPPRSAGGYLSSLLAAQGVAAVGLLPLTVWFFGQASVVGPVVNLLAIPLVTLVVVPLALLGVGLEALSGGAGQWPMRVAAVVMDRTWPLLERVANLHGALAYVPEPSLPVLLLALAGVSWLLLPRGIPGKPLAALLLVPLLWPRTVAPAAGGFTLEVLDVGQGLAAVVRTQHHVLLYDTGPAYAGGLDMGDAAVVPALRATATRRLDAVVVSHGDNDHAGGFGAVVRAFPPARVYGQSTWLRGLDTAVPASACIENLGWDWDGVEFRFLHPPPYFPEHGNEGSCVLLVRGAHGSVLLTGDIGAVVERRLQRLHADLLAVDVLLVGHHGSRHSSSAAFIAATDPQWALVSSGHRNRYGHPHPEVLTRLRRQGATTAITGEDGFLRVHVDVGGAAGAERLRHSRRRFWHETGR